MTPDPYPPHCRVAPVGIITSVFPAQMPETGALLVGLRIESPTGSAVYFLEAEQARQLGAQLTAIADKPAPLQIADPSVLRQLPPLNGR